MALQGQTPEGGISSASGSKKLGSDGASWSRGRGSGNGPSRVGVRGRGMVVLGSRLSQVGGAPDLPVMGLWRLSELRRLGPVVAMPAPFATTTGGTGGSPVGLLLNIAPLVPASPGACPQPGCPAGTPGSPGPRGRTGGRCLLGLCAVPGWQGGSDPAGCWDGEEGRWRLYRALGRRGGGPGCGEGPGGTRYPPRTAGGGALVAAWLDGGGVGVPGPQAEGDLERTDVPGHGVGWRSGAGPVA